MNVCCFWLLGGSEVTPLVGGCAGASDREKAQTNPLLAACVSSKETGSAAGRGKKKTSELATTKTCSSQFGPNLRLL